jgi:hypothetical protein
VDEVVSDRISSEAAETFSTAEPVWELGLATLVSVTIPGLGFAAGGGATLASLRAFAEQAEGVEFNREPSPFLESHGVDSQLARKSVKALKSGLSVVLVQCPTGTLLDIRVREILMKHNASPVIRSASKRSQLLCWPNQVITKAIGQGDRAL